MAHSCPDGGLAYARRRAPDHIGSSTNKYIYMGPFANYLAKEGVDLEYTYFKVHQQKMPPSHSSLPIMGIFVSPGIYCKSSLDAPRFCNHGQHRLRARDMAHARFKPKKIILTTLTLT